MEGLRMDSTKVLPARVARGVERANHHLNGQHDHACVLPPLGQQPVSPTTVSGVVAPRRRGRREMTVGVMKALGIAAAAAIALASFSVVATTPGVAQAAPFAGVGADPKSCQQCPFLVAQYRISTEPTLPELAPTNVTPVQTPQVVPPSPPFPSTIPVAAAYEEPTQPGWRLVLHYGVLVITVCFVAWMIQRSKSSSAPLTASAPRAARRGFGRGGIGGVPLARKRLVLVEAGHRCAIPTCRHPTTEIAHIVPESQNHDDSFENLIALCLNCHTQYDQKKEIDRQSIRTYKRNLGILNSRYSDFERRMFDQIAETDQRSFIVEAGFEVLLLHAVNDGLLKRVELSPLAIQRGEPTRHRYEVTDAGLNFVSRYIQGEDIP
jgi:hypothetical protein